MSSEQNGSKGGSQQVQQLIVSGYVEPARRRGERRVTVVAGDLHKALGLKNRVPQVCAAMRTQRFLREHGLEIVAASGPQSGQGTRVAITYQLGDRKPTEADGDLRALYGILRDVYAAEGGGEAYLKRERASLEHSFERRGQ